MFGFIKDIFSTKKGILGDVTDIVDRFHFGDEEKAKIGVEMAKIEVQKLDAGKVARRFIVKCILIIFVYAAIFGSVLLVFTDKVGSFLDLLDALNFGMAFILIIGFYFGNSAASKLIKPALLRAKANKEKIESDIELKKKKPVNQK